jgi:pimeloyl-ACP methyl ester carboxylesterase
MALNVLEIVDQMQLEKPIVLGFSLGGMVAQHVAAMAGPSALRTLVLLSTTQKASLRSTELLRLWRDMVLAGVNHSLIYRNQFLWTNVEQFFAHEGAVQRTLE